VLSAIHYHYNYKIHLSDFLQVDYAVLKLSLFQRKIMLPEYLPNNVKNCMLSFCRRNWLKPFWVNFPQNKGLWCDVSIVTKLQLMTATGNKHTMSRENSHILTLAPGREGRQ